MRRPLEEDRSLKLFLNSQMVGRVVRRRGRSISERRWSRAWGLVLQLGPGMIFAWEANSFQKPFALMVILRID